MKQLSIFQSFIIILMYLLHTGSTSKSVNNEISLKDKWTLSELEIKEIKEDTLLIVSFDPFLYYPFGKFRDIDSLNKRLSDLQLKISYDDNRTDLKYSQNENKLYFLKFAFDKNADEFDPEHEFIQIYSINIVDSSVVLNKS